MEYTKIVEKINKIDLEPILFTLTKRDDWTLWSLDKAKRVEKLYRQFLTLIVLYPDKSIVPTKEIDEFWHTHILDTEKYMSDCQNTFGYYIHHFPYYGLRGKKDEEKANKSFDETCKLFKKHFNMNLVRLMSKCDGSGRCSSHCKQACGPKKEIFYEERPKLTA